MAHSSLPTAGSTRINPSTVNDPLCQQVMQKLDHAELDVGIWETTSDVGVASYRCLIVEQNGVDGHIGVGDGCHSHRGIALLRALTEAVQTRMTYVSGSRDDIGPAEFTNEALKEKSDYVRYLIGTDDPVRSFEESPHFDSDDFEEDLNRLLANLLAVGCDEVFAVNLSRHDIGVSVVRTVIPGLEAPHDDDSYKAGSRAIAFERALS
jgi:YcaO-like protein with predicted kinase domain